MYKRFSAAISNALIKNLRSANTKEGRSCCSDPLFLCLCECVVTCLYRVDVPVPLHRTADVRRQIHREGASVCRLLPCGGQRSVQRVDGGSGPLHIRRDVGSDAYLLVAGVIVWFDGSVEDQERKTRRRSHSKLL